MKKCIIVGAGVHFAHRPLPEPGDLVIAADGGYAQLPFMGIKADIIIGDFDSLPDRPKGIEIAALPKEKDDTDMLAAIKHGLENGYRAFHIFGGTGGRADHTLANLQCLAYLARHAAQGFLYGQNDVTTCIRNGGMDFDRGHKGMVSVFAHSDTAVGVCLEGLKYPLHEATLDNAFPLGVSNEFTGTASRIFVREGTLMILFQHHGPGIY